MIPLRFAIRMQPIHFMYIDGAWLTWKYNKKVLACLKNAQLYHRRRAQRYSRLGSKIPTNGTFKVVQYGKIVWPRRLSGNFK